MDDDDDFLKGYYKKKVRNSIIALFVIGTIWAVVISLVGEGTWGAIVNILFFIISIIFGVTIQTYLRGFLNSRLAWIISLSVFVLVIFFYRSFIMSLL